MGCDKSQEWMLPWTLANIRDAGCNLPVAFADFGMTAPTRRWCERLGVMVMSIPRNPRLLTWCMKPIAIRDAPFRVALWLDNDVEALRDLTPIFDELGDYDLAAANDPPNRIAPHWNTGVVLARTSSSILPQWVAASLTGRHRGDQEALNALWSKVRHDIRTIDSQYNRLRLAGPEQPGDFIRHWTGPTGKATIREKIAAAGAMAQATT